MRTIVEVCGDDARDICADCYGYNLSWLFHSVAQNLDKELEQDRIEALTTVSLLLELGLPAEAASKVFLAGVRSRTAAVELGKLVVNPKVSVLKLRNALMNKETQEKIAKSIKAATLEWLRLLSSEHPTPAPTPPVCAKFKLNTPADVETLHVRIANERLFLCSVDSRFKFATKATERFPFHSYANDPRHVFVRDGEFWTLKDRYPRLPNAQDSEEIF